MNEKATAEFEIKVSGGRITNAQALVLPDGKCKIVVDFESTASLNQRGSFIKVLASELRIDDEFMKHQPKNKKEQNFKELVETAIKGGLEDFWCPKYAPSFNKAGTGICFKSAMMPAIGKSFIWWEKIAENFDPFHKSHLGTKTERIAFLAVLIKELVANGWTVAQAWHAVCNESSRLGHCKNSKNAYHKFEYTGYREICGFCDLGNTMYFVAEDKGGKHAFYVAGAPYWVDEFSLTDMVDRYSTSADYNDCVGWIVLGNYL